MEKNLICLFHTQDSLIFEIQMKIYLMKLEISVALFKVYYTTTDITYGLIGATIDLKLEAKSNQIIHSSSKLK